MLDTLLHTGLDHPNLLWIVVPALATFAAGLGLGLRSRRETDESTADAVPEPEE
jgi:hypothetical protein